MSQTNTGQHYFPLGRVLITCGAEQSIPKPEVQAALRRHHSGDWGEVCRDDWTANDESVKDQGRLLSSYTAANGIKFWIITEADREATTVLLPSDY